VSNAPNGAPAFVSGDTMGEKAPNENFMGIFVCFAKLTILIGPILGGPYAGF
jgi:hypothetical protein